MQSSFIRNGSFHLVHDFTLLPFYDACLTSLLTFLHIVNMQELELPPSSCNNCNTGHVSILLMSTTESLSVLDSILQTQLDVRLKY